MIVLIFVGCFSHLVSVVCTADFINSSGIVDAAFYSFSVFASRLLIANAIKVIKWCGALTGIFWCSISFRSATWKCARQIVGVFLGWRTSRNIYMR